MVEGESLLVLLCARPANARFREGAQVMVEGDTLLVLLFVCALPAAWLCKGAQVTVEGETLLVFLLCAR